MKPLKPAGRLFHYLLGLTAFCLAINWSRWLEVEVVAGQRGTSSLAPSRLATSLEYILFCNYYHQIFLQAHTYV